MVKAYLRYEQIQAFGVITTPASAPVTITKSDAQIATATLDAITLWNVRTGASVHRLGNASTRAAGLITALYNGDDGLIAGHADGSVRVWTQPRRDQTTLDPFASAPTPRLVLSGLRTRVTSLHARAGVCVGAAADGDVVLWDLSDGHARFRLPAHTQPIVSVILIERPQHGDIIVSASQDGLVKVFDIADQHCMQTIVGHTSHICAMTYHPALGLLLTASVDADIHAWRVVDQHIQPAHDTLAPTNGVLHSLGSVQRTIAADRVVSLFFTEVDHVIFAVVAGADRAVDIFRVRDARSALKRARKRSRREQAVSVADEENKHTKRDESQKDTNRDGVAEHPQETLRDLFVAVRHLRFKTRLHSVTTMPAALLTKHGSSSKLSPELLLVVQSRHNAIEIHGAAVSGTRHDIADEEEEDDEDVDVEGGGDESVEGKEAEESKDDTNSSKTKKTKKKKSKNKRKKRERAVVSVGEVTRRVLLNGPGHRRAPRGMAITRDGNTLLTASEGDVKVWNVATGACIRTIEFEGQGMCSTLVGGDERFAVMGGRGGVLAVVDLNGGTVVWQEEKAHDGDIRSVCLDGEAYEAETVISGGADGRVRLWSIEEDVRTPRLSRTMKCGSEVMCVSVADTRERRLLLIALTDNTVRTYFLDTLEPYVSLYGHRLPVQSMSTSSDGALLATGSGDKTVKVWGLDFGDCRRSLRAHDDTVVTVRFQPKTHYLLTGGRDGHVKYWDADKHELICELGARTAGGIRSMAVCADGEVLAFSGTDCGVRIWRRTDEPLFLEEERDARMDSLFESTLVEEEVKEARKERVHGGVDIAGNALGDAQEASIRTLDAVKGGESLLEALQVCADAERDTDDADDADDRDGAGGGRRRALLLLSSTGSSPHDYLLHALTRIQTRHLEGALGSLPLTEALTLLQRLSHTRTQRPVPSALHSEVVVRACMHLVRVHDRQIHSSRHASRDQGALSRASVAQLRLSLSAHVRMLRTRFGTAQAALAFWNDALQERAATPDM